MSPEGAAARKTREPQSAAPLATVHGADELIYFRLRRLLGGIGLRTELVSGPPARGGARGTPAIAIVIASGPTDGSPAQRCDVEMVVLTATPSETGAREALELGAIGYLPLHLEDATLSKALGAIVAGEAGFSRTVLGQWLRSRNGYIRSSDAPQLTQRQRQILERIARGEADKQIAQHLGIATATVQKHVQLLLRRLQVPNRAGAVRYARVARAEEPT